MHSPEVVHVILNRDDFTQKTKNELARRVGGLCSNPICRTPTIGPSSTEHSSVSIGVAAHITAAAPNGPRYDRNKTAEERSSPSNGIWLCETCASLIDKDWENHPVEVLLEWKRDAEQAARSALGIATHGDANNVERGNVTYQVTPRNVPPFAFAFTEDIPTAFWEANRQDIQFIDAIWIDRAAISVRISNNSGNQIDIVNINAKCTSTILELKSGLQFIPQGTRSCIEFAFDLSKDTPEAEYIEMDHELVKVHTPAFSQNNRYVSIAPGSAETILLTLLAPAQPSSVKIEIEFTGNNGSQTVCPDGCASILIAPLKLIPEKDRKWRTRLNARATGDGFPCDMLKPYCGTVLRGGAPCA